jgi:NAD(P)H dehydrogenase (quinone)
MATRVLVVYYSLHGHVESLARAVGAGAESVRNTTARLRRFPDRDGGGRVPSGTDEATVDDLRWADAIAWGTPTRYGAMAAPMTLFLERMSDVWKSGDLEDKPAGVFTSTASIHGGQESTILTTLVPLLHFGMIFVGTPYVQNPQIMTTDAIGGSPYGPATIAGPDGSRAVADVELAIARSLGVRLARVASGIKIIRVTAIRGQDIDAPAYGGSPASRL